MDVWEEVNKGLMPQYGTGMHWPYCRMASCTGCLREMEPVLEASSVHLIPAKLDLSIFRKD